MSRLLTWTDDAWSDYLYWQTQDKKTLKRINKIIDDIKRAPFDGIGKPEPLKIIWSLLRTMSALKVLQICELKLLEVKLAVA